MKERKFPCICVKCPDCGFVFMGSIFSAGVLAHDKDLLIELEKYAKEGYDILVKDESEFKVNRCACNNFELN